jgi:hypothetical protein
MRRADNKNIPSIGLLQRQAKDGWRTGEREVKLLPLEAMELNNTAAGWRRPRYYLLHFLKIVRSRSTCYAALLP